jgi:hypothetical protein
VTPRSETLDTPRLGARNQGETMNAKRTGTRLAIAAMALGGAMFVGTAAQAAPAPKPLQTFGNGTVTATADAATIVNDGGEYGGVYLSSKSNSSKGLATSVFQFRNNGGDVGGGAPRFSLPIDTDGVGKTVEGYAFLDVAGCGGTSGDNTLVSTQSGTCHVNFNGTDYANWTTFAAANPTYRMAPGAIPFIIADVPGSYAVDSIVLR